jgi:hypothetical protein
MSNNIASPLRYLSARIVHDRCLHSTSIHRTTNIPIDQILANQSSQKHQNSIEVSSLKYFLDNVSLKPRSHRSLR